jgi:hypothetical protein
VVSWLVQPQYSHHSYFPCQNMMIFLQLLQ